MRALSTSSTMSMRSALLRPVLVAMVMREGDWTCEECGASPVFASRMDCFRCGALRPSSDGGRGSPQPEFRKNFAGTRCFVENLSFDTDWPELKDHFLAEGCACCPLAFQCPSKWPYASLMYTRPIADTVPTCLARSQIQWYMRRCPLTEVDVRRDAASSSLRRCMPQRMRASS